MQCEHLDFLRCLADTLLIASVLHNHSPFIKSSSCIFPKKKGKKKKEKNGHPFIKSSSYILKKKKKKGKKERKEEKRKKKKERRKKGKWGLDLICNLSFYIYMETPTLLFIPTSVFYCRALIETSPNHGFLNRYIPFSFLRDFVLKLETNPTTLLICDSKLVLGLCPTLKECRRDTTLKS